MTFTATRFAPRLLTGGKALLGALALVAGLAAAGPAAAQGQPVRGGTLSMILNPEPAVLVSGVNSSSPVAAVSPKMFEGLVTYDPKFKMLPQLAVSWNQSADGKTITFKLRPGVKWHDGKPFTSADVQFSFMEILKKYHSRGTATFQHLVAVETPDDLTAVFKLDEPSPYIMRALAGVEAPIMPKHIYEGSDPLKNPANLKPIGTGPFKFKEWERGNYIMLERNPDYWDKGKPYLDNLVFRIIPDGSARAVALESGAVQYGTQYVVPLNDVERLSKLPNLAVTTAGYEYNTSVNYLEFNLRRPYLADRRVRQAIAYTINTDFLVKNVWFGFATKATSPITDKQADFHTSNIPQYPYDLKKAEQLLDEAGMKKGPDGIRFKVTIDWSPSGEMFRQTAELLRQGLQRVGIQAEIRNSDNPTYLRRVWTDNDFDINIFSASNIADPVIGIQRFYWSKSIQKGVSYSNGSGYNNPEMDKILESAQIENNPAKRKKLYEDMQRLVMTDLPNMGLVYIQWFTIYDKKIKNLNTTGLGPYESFADVYMEK
ncbi:MAG TPA: ABC transporter substrate-binding protein [Alphaproteobacteria bacterium]